VPFKELCMDTATKIHSLVHNVAKEEEGLNDDEDQEVCGRDAGW